MSAQARWAEHRLARAERELLQAYVAVIVARGWDGFYCPGLDAGWQLVRLRLADAGQGAWPEVHDPARCACARTAPQAGAA